MATWNGDPNQPIALDDKEGLALYRKSVDFECYCKQHRLLASEHGRNLPHYDKLVRARKESIARFEKQYPDFKAAYEQRQKL